MMSGATNSIKIIRLRDARSDCNIGNGRRQLSHRHKSGKVLGGGENGGLDESAQLFASLFTATDEMEEDSSVKLLRDDERLSCAVINS